MRFQKRLLVTGRGVVISKESGDHQFGKMASLGLVIGGVFFQHVNDNFLELYYTGSVTTDPAGPVVFGAPGMNESWR